MSLWTNKFSSTLLTVLGLFMFQGANAQTVDDDFYQHATVDSTIALDTSFQLWVFLRGPRDTEFATLSQVFQNQQFTITISDSSFSYFVNDTLFFWPDFGTMSGTTASLIWTNTYDDDADTLSGPIDGLVMRMKISTSPSDSITEATWGSSTAVLARNATHLPNVLTEWTIALGSGGQPDSATIVGLDNTKNYWFALRVRDEANNWSLMSNNAFKDLSAGLDSTTTQVYTLVTTWNKWNGTQWDSGPSGPITSIEVTLGVVPEGESFNINSDNN